MLIKYFIHYYDNVTLLLDQGALDKRILIFDEPGQQRMKPEDLFSLKNSLVEFGEIIQVIIGLTVDETIKEYIASLEEKDYKLILIEEKSIAPL